MLRLCYYWRVKQTRGAAAPLERNVNNNYYRWLVADTSSQLGTSIRQFALPVLVVLAGGSNTQAGTLFAVSSLMVGILALVGGVIIDRYDRRKLFLIFSALGVIIFGSASLWLLLNPVTWALLLLIAILTGTRSGLLGNTSNVMLRHIVPSQELPRAMAVNQGRDASIELGGPLLGGLLAGFGALATFLTEAVLGLIALVNVYFLPRCAPGEEAPGEGGAEPAKAAGTSSQIAQAGATEAPNVWRRAATKVWDLLVEAAGGVLVIKRNSILLITVLTSALFFPLLNGVIFALVLSAVNSGRAPVSAAFLNGAVAVGVLLGSILAGYLTQKLRTGHIIMMAFILPVIFATLALLAQDFWLRLLALAPMLVLLPSGNAAFGGFMMKLIPKDMLGRVFAFLQVLGIAVGPLVGLFVGVGLDRYSLNLTAGILIAIMALVSLGSLVPALRNIPTPDKWDEYLDGLSIRR